MYEDKITNKHGDLGEKLLDAYFLEKEVIAYGPIFEGSHAVDRIYYARKTKQFFLADVKTKAARTFYPDTGLDLVDYQNYKELIAINHLNLWLFFVDEHSKSVYGNSLNLLEKPITIKKIQYPLIEKGIIYFPLVSMKTYFLITIENAKELKILSNRNYQYSQEASRTTA